MRKKASDIIRQKLIDNGGSVQISSLRGNPIYVKLSEDCEHFDSPQLPPRKKREFGNF